jgi:hypothetical protein
MKRKLLVLGFCLFLSAATVGCDLVKDMIVLEGSGNVVTISEEFTGFTRVEAGHSFDVEIIQGDEYSVVLHVDENFVDYLDVTKRGNTLDLDLKENYSYQFLDGVLEVTITMPELLLVRLSGASDARMVGFDSNARFEAALSGASSLTGDLGAGDVVADVSGASKLSGKYVVDDTDLTTSGASIIQLSGSGGSLVVDASGNSTVNLEEFVTSDAKVNVSGASEVVLNASETVDVTASGASEVYQTGSGNFGDIDSSGASRVNRK